MKMNKGKILFWTLSGLVVLAGGAYAVMFFNKNKEDKANSSEGSKEDEKKQANDPIQKERTNPYLSGSDSSKTEQSVETNPVPTVLSRVAKNLGSKAVLTSTGVNYAFRSTNGNKYGYVISYFANGRFSVKGVYSGKVLVKGNYSADGKVFKTDGNPAFSSIALQTISFNLQKLANELTSKGLI